MCVCMPHIRADCQNASYATEAGLSDTWLASKFRGERFLPGARGVAPLRSLPSGEHCFHQGEGSLLARTVRVHPASALSPREHHFQVENWKTIAIPTAFRDQCVIEFFRRKIEFLAVRVYVCHRIVHDRHVDCFNFL